MKDVQAILREIVNDLEKIAAGLTVLDARVEALRPTPGYQTQNEMNMVVQANRRVYDELRQKIEELT